MVIVIARTRTRTASTNIAFKVATMRDSITVGQHEFIRRRMDSNNGL